MEVRFFGEFEALEAGVPVPVRGTKQRRLLALLALHRGRPVRADRLIDVLWGDAPVANSGKRLAGSDRPAAPHLRGERSSPPRPATPSTSVPKPT